MFKKSHALICLRTLLKRCQGEAIAALIPLEKGALLAQPLSQNTPKPARNYVGADSEEVIAFGIEQKWPWPKDPTSFLGQNYRVAQCFVYHINPEGKIDFMRQYLDTGSVWAQLK